MPAPPKIYSTCELFLFELWIARLSLIDTSTVSTIASIRVAASPHGMAISQDGTTVYVTGDGSSSLNVIDTAADHVTKTIDVGKEPIGITPDGKLLLVTLYGEDRIALVDTATKTTWSERYQFPSPILSGSSQAASWLRDIAGARHFGIAVIDFGSRSLIRTVPLDKTPRDGEFGDDGKALLFCRSRRRCGQGARPDLGQDLGTDPDRPIAPFRQPIQRHQARRTRGTGTRTADAVRSHTNKEVRSIAVGKQSHWAALSPHGKTAYVNNEGSNDMSVVNLESGKVTTVAVGQGPRKLVVQGGAKRSADIGGGAKVSIANFAFSPSSITVHPGESITWSNDDGSPHALVFNDAVGGTVSLSPGQSFTRTFAKAGTHDYSCSFHPYMTTKVVVA